MNQKLIYFESGTKPYKIQQNYVIGTKKSEELDLRNADLRGANLRYIDFQGANLFNADLRGANLNGSNLREANLNGAKLNGANLQGTSLHKALIIGGCFIEANLSGADLRDTSLDVATFSRANLQGADLSEAYLKGADLEGANLNGAYYSISTYFSDDINPIKLGMQLAVTISVEDLLNKFNYLSHFSQIYLGSTITAKYWDLSRPELEWLHHFEVHRSSQITFSGSSTELISNLQLHWSQQWINSFIKHCNGVIRNFASLVDQSQVTLGVK